MEVKPGYKQTDVGVIPEEWEVQSLIGIADPKRPIRYGIVQVGPFTRSGTPVLAIKNLNTDYVTNVHRSSPRIEVPYARSRVTHGDVLISVKGTTGRVGLVPLHFAGNISRDIARVGLTDNDVPEFWFQMLQSETGRRNLDLATVGTTRMELSIGILKHVRMPRPPKEEQRAIAEALSDVDALLGGMDRLIAKKRDLKQAAMQQLLIGQNRLPGFHGEWSHVCLGEMFTFKNGLNKGKEFFGFGTPIVNYMDVFGNAGIVCSKLEGRVSLSNSEIKNFNVRKGDVLFTRTSETPDEIGMASVILDEPDQTVFSGFVLRGRPKDDRLCDAFKAYCFRSSFVRKQIISKASYTTRALTNGRILSAVILPVPPPTEQTAIATVLSDMDAELAALEQRREKTRAIKQGMMQELLTGRTRLV